MKRRTFITLLGGSAAAWPLTARAQQADVPVVGFLSQGSAETDTEHSQAFRKGLSEAGFSDGRNIAIEYRWANFQVDRLPGLAADLVRRQAAVIAATTTLGTVLAAKEAAATTPIVFNVGFDPVKAGLVAALNKPGGHIIGITSLNIQLGTKHVGLGRETSRPAGLAADQVPSCHQSEHREGAAPADSANPARACRRGD
jgi:putative ABC transport system substrate-binding protein